REQALLEAFHRPGEGGAERDGIHPEVVAHLVRPADGDQVIEAQIDAERRERFVFRAAVARIDAVPSERIHGDTRTAFVDGLLGLTRGLLLLLDVDDLLAPHRARVARAHADADLVAYGDRVHLADGVGGAHSIVQHGHAAFEALALHRGPGAELVEG